MVTTSDTARSYNSSVSKVTPGRFREGVRLVRSLLVYHRKPFVIAVTGAAIYACCTVASSFAVSRMIDSVIQPYFIEEGSILGVYLAASGLIIGIGFVRAMAVIVRRSFAGVTQWRTSASLAERIMRSLLKRPYVWHLKHQPGDLVARVGVDADAAVAVLAPLPYGSSVFVLIIVSSVALLRVDILLGSLALVVLPSMLLLNVVYQRRVDRHFDAAQSALGAFSEAAYESLEGYSVVKAFGAEHRETQRMAVISSRLREARIRAIKGRATFDGLMDAIPALVNVGLIVVGAIRVRDGALTIGELSGFVYLFTLLVFPLRIVGYVFSEFPHSRSGMARVEEVLAGFVEDEKCSIDVVDPHNAVEIDGVTLRYGEDPVLHDVSLVIPRGSMVALVGPTGSGKSSLLLMIAGLLPPASGRLSKESGTTSIVFQEPFLFDGTVRDNVLLGAADESRLEEALRLSCSTDFVSHLPKGLDTTTGERGVGLSGGQRQRLCLARALCRDNSILLLDDTTSALDTTNERMVLESLRALRPRPTTVMATSRPSVIKTADLIVFISAGRVRHVGRHEDLLGLSPEYVELVTSYESSLAHE